MSWFYYFASNKKLEKQPNPYIYKLSIREALARNIEIDMDFVEGLDFDQPEVLLYVEKEEDLLYPNIFEIRKEDSMGTDKMYCMELEWNFNSKHIDVILDYIKKQMLDNEEIELWKIWQGRNRHHKKPVYCTYLINELNKVIFTQFFEGEEDYKCMKIIK